MTDQTEFTAALLDPSMALPAGLLDPKGLPTPKRFAVYRNNVAVSLTDALEAAFPVIYKLVGPDFFRAMAGIYLRQHPPKTPMMMFYGQDMPAFLQQFEPAQKIGYLPDIAQLELAIRQSYHAADSSAIAPDVLQNMPPDQLMTARLSLAPSMQMVTSPWPIHAIWQVNMSSGAPKPQMQAEEVLITRPEYDPQVALLPPGAATFITALRTKSFGEAFSDAAELTPDFDLTITLGALLAGGAITNIIET
ncbi:DNA-binding domain-containing protein [Parasulfitobacter algicola]|uniref:DNA-binding domain-containing protein n=1 Tax=Parasulfitobacter algicola TaxID=2614809 RepID=A0ABX2IW86_9RHOB|nr:DNA-binding domain-containing protein [Sulfitobacter algicola]NSX54478.1 putative DNA-binding domain-containing protein [Sulfitobacter algicola]